MPSSPLLPIRKLAVGFVTSLLALAARKLGADIGPDLLNQAAVVIVGYAAAYAVKDPRVKAAKDEIDHSALAKALVEDPRVREAAEALYASAVAERIKEAVSEELARLGFKTAALTPRAATPAPVSQYSTPPVDSAHTVTPPAGR